ncbi:MAG: phosphoenolpyruvate carboxykinase (ATP) [Bacteroidetes bacterium]|nr:phosphoenolpyruvate carboxykinase (ATP) [Bacteroidota bacterium]
MAVHGKKTANSSLEEMGLSNLKNEFWNLSPEELANETVSLHQGVFADNGAVAVNTGEFTGRSPEDRFIVRDAITETAVDWNKINIPVSTDMFDKLYNKICAYFQGKDVYVRDAYACADEKFKLNIRVVTEYPWSNMFAYNMFLRPTQAELDAFNPEWTILNAPGFMAVAAEDGTRQHNFAVLNFTKKCIIIGGTGYTGEIKKGIFSVLNFVLPHQKNVLSMHCSANIGKDGDTALFFGLSGTGKTTLSADPNRALIGDDEHGWSEDGVFNFEGGCYAKVIDLNSETEPDIYKAIRSGAILENIGFKNGNEPDYTDSSITLNTRVSYPIYHIENRAEPSVGGIPKNIFFLTYDAFGVLPPISKLTEEQAMYHFMSGFTSKVAGTEVGITEPKTTFSACFGAAFLPLHPSKYAEMLGNKMKACGANAWLVNTGLSGGSYGTGKRMSLKITRALINAALNGNLNEVGFENHPIFGVAIPNECPGVPSDVLHPRNTWANKEAYDQTALKLAKAFQENFKKFEKETSKEILEAAPVC